MTAERVESTLIRTGDSEWRAAQAPGVFIQILRSDKAGGASSFLLKLDAGAQVPAHDHPGGEELFVLAGDFQVGDDILRAGDYLYTPPNAVHSASSEGGCLVLVMLPQPVRILAD
jgi:quercetin dioxygenase-like cupin family protein